MTKKKKKKRKKKWAKKLINFFYLQKLPQKDMNEKANPYKEKIHTSNSVYPHFKSKKNPTFHM
jgi:hypothetical protein